MEMGDGVLLGVVFVVGGRGIIVFLGVERIWLCGGRHVTGLLFPGGTLP